jgi:voltage-gated potassium channel
MPSKSTPSGKRRNPERKQAKPSAPTASDRDHLNPEEGINAADSMPLLVFIYALLPTATMAGLVADYFYQPSSQSLALALIVGAWVLFRGLPVATKRLLGKPIPTKKRVPHVLRMYFFLLVILIPYLITFGALYYGLGHSHADSCTNVTLDKVSSLYFTVTIFTTTGFGDIYAVTDGCRAVVTVQMVSGFIVVSILIAMFIARLFQLITEG